MAGACGWASAGRGACPLGFGFGGRIAGPSVSSLRQDDQLRRRRCHRSRTPELTQRHAVVGGEAGDRLAADTDACGDVAQAVSLPVAQLNELLSRGSVDLALRYAPPRE